jgi:hypothetical protein
VETVAAGVGIVIVPMSVARLHHRKDVVHRPVTDVGETRIGLAWRRDLEDDRVEAFVGVIRGRSASSSRGPGGSPGAGGSARTGGSPRQDARDRRQTPKKPAPRRQAQGRTRRRRGR